MGQVRSSTTRLEQAADSLTGHEKFATLLLDHHRNRLLKFDVVITGFSAAVGLGAMIAGIFGMNTPSTVFDSEGYGRAPTFAFPLVALLICSMVLILVVVLTVWLYCRPRFGSNRPRGALPPEALRTAAAGFDTSPPGGRGSQMTADGRFSAVSPMPGGAKRLSGFGTVKELLLSPSSAKSNPAFVLRGSASGAAPPESAGDTELGSVPSIGENIGECDS